MLAYYELFFHHMGNKKMKESITTMTFLMFFVKVPNFIVKLKSSPSIKAFNKRR
jgi:hypothetical protein